MILALLVGACAAPQPASAPDPATARIYADVGESERSAGATDSALAAFQEALRLDPSNEIARRGLDVLCFEEGRRLLDAGDARGAAEKLQGGQGRPAKLLEGIARYEIGDDDTARPLLEDAANEAKLASAARLYLGLIALRTDEPRLADAQLSQVPADAPFAETAAELLRTARRSGKLVLSALAESGYDSNVTLLPSGAPGGKDGMASLAFAAVGRPRGESGPWLRASGLYRPQFTLHDYDLAAIGGAAGWQLGRVANHVGVEYDYDYRTLGAAPYLSAHKLGADAAKTIGQMLWTANYSIRFESYKTDVTSNFSGTLHSAELLAGTAAIRGGWHVGRDFAQYADTSYFEHGPHIVADLPIGSRWQVSADLSAVWRKYQGADQALSLLRSDVLLDASVAGELDLTDQLALRLATSGRHAVSNAPDLSYDRLTLTLGLVAAAGFF